MAKTKSKQVKNRGYKVDDDEQIPVQALPRLTHLAWTLVNHMATWIEVVARRLTERKPIAEPEAGDFPAVTATSAAACADALGELDR